MSLLKRIEPFPNPIPRVDEELEPPPPMIDVLTFQALSGIPLPIIVGYIEERAQRHYSPIPISLIAPQATSDRSIILYSGPGLDYQVD